ncbi:glycosyltransferase [Candidatus Peregrinibacteria bacterium]|nr:glycosyltransferase [Candidatus Peregrinibacteria bacterium]
MCPLSDKIMKIAIDIRSAEKEKTGKGWYTFNIVKELLKLDRENQYFLYTAHKDKPFDSRQNVEYVCIDSSPSKWHFKVLKDLNQKEVDVFFAPSSYIIPAFASKKLKVVLTIHDLVAFLFPSNHQTRAVIIERLTLKQAIKKAAHVITVSENTKKDIIEKFTYPNEKITVAKCSASKTFLKPIPEKDLHDFKNKMKLPDKFILGVSTIEPRKNFPNLIKSFVLIKKRHPDYKLVIAGKKGWKTKEVDKALKEFNLHDDVIFTGYIKENDLSKLYRLADVFVFPSLYEGFGIPPLEAMSAGCPVVASNISAMPEVIGEAGLIVDPKNAYKLSDAISSIIENEHVREMLIERGLRQVEKFSWTDSAQKILNIFMQLKNEN